MAKAKKSAPRKTSAPKAQRAKATPGAVRTAVAALGGTDVLAQLRALDEVFANGDPAAAARAVLAATDKGAPVARAYLEVRASDGADPLPAANTVVAYCAALQVGRKIARPAFLHSWRRASEFGAIETAYKNIARIAIDDPELLAAGVATAHRNNDARELADRRARLERALRLQPLLAELAGTAPARARGTRQLGALSADDRWHVYARVLDNPKAYDHDLAVTAVQTLVDDPRAPDMALAAGVLDLPERGKADLVAAWKPRVAANDATLITRLLALFEWTGLWATDAAAFEPYIAALRPAGRQREVFAQVEDGVALDKPIVREAILAKWLSEQEGFDAFSQAQADMLMRSALAIAEGGTTAGDQVAANRVVAFGGGGHTGVRTALADAIRNTQPSKQNPELRANLYHGIGRVVHPDVTAFLVERLFVERDEYSALLGALGKRLDLDTHRLVLDMLSERRRDADAIHAATLYTDAVLAHHGSPRLVGDIARMVLTWQPATPDDKRRLRYIFEQATVAALAIKQPGDARTFLARARQLDVTPYSDYAVKDRDVRTPSAFADAANKKAVAALEVGTLDKDIAVARETAEAARKSGTPHAATDEHLGLLAGCSVTRRFFEDRDSHEVWFFDEVGDLVVYDGFGVALPAFQVTGTDGQGIPYYGMSAFIAGRTRIDERAVLFDAKFSRVREILRFADRLVVLDGRGDGALAVQALGLKFADAIAAREAVARFVAHPPEGTTRVDPWYIAGSGAVRRRYHMPLPNAGWNAEGEATLEVLGSRIEGPLEHGPPLERIHATPEAAVAAMQAWEAQIFAGGGRITELALDRDARRREDTLLSSFLDARHREDTASAAWHLRGLVEMLEAIDGAGLRPLVPGVSVELGPPCTAAEVGAYQEEVSEAIPAQLVDAWREVGGGGFTTPRLAIRLMPPHEVLARRTELRGKLRAMGEPRADAIDVIAVAGDAPLILYDTERTDRCFASPGNDWAGSLAWQIATEINLAFKRELEHALGDIYRLKLGQRASAEARRVRLAKGNQQWEAIVDGTQLLTRTLGGRPAIKQLADAAAAARAFEDAIGAARAKGFTDG